MHYEELDDYENALDDAARLGTTMRWSNFLITISTNVSPHTYMQRTGMTQWIYNVAQDLFQDFETLNGVLIKPAGSQNDAEERFPEDNLIAGVKARVTIEQGPGKKQMHAHILVEICHHYTNRNEYGLAGVHINRKALNNYWDSRIDEMPIPPIMRPRKVYLNNRLITKGTDNSAKWLTLAYLNKDRDAEGTDLQKARRNASEPDKMIYASFMTDAAVDMEV
jgi:hypothetical protein